MIAAFALHKTVTFLMYGLLVFLFAGFPMMFAKELWSVSARTAEWLYIACELISLSILLCLVIKGYLPGTHDPFIQPFSERQIATACMTLAVGTWVLAGFSEQGKIIRMVVNGALAVCITVYFVVKSVLSRQLRWQVLYVLILPALELWFEKRTAP